MSLNLVNRTDGSTEVVAGGTLYADAPIGSIQAYGGTVIPNGWLFCQGQAIDRATYPELFSIIGTAFGAGDGSTTFNLPDFRETVPVGIGENDTATIESHDTYTLGQFKDDQLQGHAFQVSTDENRGTTSGTDYKNTRLMKNIYANYKYSINTIITDGINGTPRVGNTTHSKQLGVNYIIKAVHVAMPASGWSDITSDWSLPYSSAGTPTLEKVLWRPSTQELKVIVDAHDISVAGSGSWSIVAAYTGTDQDIINMKNHPFEHATSIMPTNPRGTYTLAFVPGSIQFDATAPEFYATVRNVLSGSSSTKTLEHVVYHITL